jgi:hypothetical protein
MDTIRGVRSWIAWSVLAVGMLLSGCKAQHVAPDYGRPLPPGGAAHG